MRLDNSFAPYLHESDLEEIDRAAEVTFAVDADGRLMMTNEAWDRFALENGAADLPREWPLGRNLFEAVPPDLEHFYRDGWEWAVSSGHPWSHTYECSTPNQFRRMRMTCYPVGPGGLLVVNSLLAEAMRPDGEASELDRAEYLDGNVLTQCSHCRRTRHPASGRWDWVPEWVHRWPSNARPALCGPCGAYHTYAVTAGVSA
jgi:hypothetical protein